MAATDARPVPIKNTAFRYYFSIRKSDGTLITSWTGQDSEVSLDGAAFSDCTNEATEISTSGCGYLDLTSSEMNADAVTLKITVTNTSALPLVVTFFPQEGADIKVDATHFGGTAGTFSGGRPEVNATHFAGTAYASADFSSTMKASINTEADTALTDYGALKPTTAGRTLLVDTSGFVTYANTAPLDAAGVRSAVGLASANLDTQLSGISSKTTNLPSDPADASDIAGALSTVNSTLSTIAGYIDTEVAAILAAVDTEVGAIKAKTDQLTFTVANQVDANALSGGGGGLDAAGVRSAIGLASANLDTQLADIPTVSELNARTLAAADYATATALATVDDFLDLEIAAILEDTGTTIPGLINALSIPTTTQIADAVLSRNVSNVESSAGEHTLCTMVLAGLESSVSGTTWTIKRTDGTTTHATKAVTVDASADPITGVS